MRMNGAVELQSWTSSSSIGSTSSTVWIQLLVSCRSGTRPPASIAVPAAIRAGEAEPVTRARSVTSWALSPSFRALGSAATRSTVPLLKVPMTSAAGSSPAGSGADSALTSSL